MYNLRPRYAQHTAFECRIIEEEFPAVDPESVRHRETSVEFSPLRALSKTYNPTSWPSFIDKPGHLFVLHRTIDGRMRRVGRGVPVLRKLVQRSTRSWHGFGIVNGLDEFAILLPHASQYTGNKGLPG